MPNIRSAITYWFDCALGNLRTRPQWTVTWPTLPGGVYTIAVRRAAGIGDAIEQALAAHAPTAPGYTLAYYEEPEVWQVKPSPARRVAGPNYYGEN